MTAAAELLERAADLAEQTSVGALARWGVTRNPITDSLMRDAAALRLWAERLEQPTAEMVERVARAIYEAMPQQYVSTIRVGNGEYSEPVTVPATWDDEPDMRREYVLVFARAAIGAMG